MAAKELFLGLGSNEGNSQLNIKKSIDMIQSKIGSIIGLSSLYSAQAWGKTDQKDFLNQVVRIWTELSPTQLLEQVTVIENELGRIRGEKWGQRTIDIDILYLGNLIIDTDQLQIPHPELTERNFVLIPLVEIAPDFLHPIFKLSNKELLQFCDDKLLVTKC